MRARLSLIRSCGSVLAGAGLAIAVILAWPHAAAAETVARLPLGSHFASLAVASSGRAWVSAETARSGRWALINARGRTRWTSYPTTDGFIGALSARPDGGAWMLADLRTVLRIGPDEQASTLGPLDVPFSPDPHAARLLRTVSGSDGSFIVVDELGSILRVDPAGTAIRQEVHVPAPRRDGDCIYVDAAPGDGGVVALSDYRCWRIVVVGPFGVVRTIDLRPTHGRRYPGGLVVGADGSLWFTAVTLRGARVRHVIGHVTSNGRVTQVPAPNATLGPAGFSPAPDGAVWAAIPRTCALYRVRADRVQRLNTPYPVRDIQFSPDGSAWLQGYSRLAHMTAEELAAADAPRRCDGRSPRMTFPMVERQQVSLRTLTRAGFRVRSNEPATLSGNISLGDRILTVHKVIRRAGATATLRFPRADLAAAASRLRQGATVELSIGGMELRDASGNGVVSPQEFHVAAARATEK